MRHRFFRISLLLFVVAWFGVMVPGHRRGQIVLAGCQKACCDPFNKTPSGPNHESPPQPAACAVCHLIAALDLPTPVQLHVPPLAFVRPVEFCPPSSPFDTEIQFTCYERGPPVV